MYILDIEASGLGEESYPIEIAWCAIDGSDDSSFLINPNSAGDWDSWDDHAESAIHGISRNECCDRGENVVMAARRLEKLLSEYLVFSDAPYQDQKWMNQLFYAAGRRSPAILMPIEQAVHPSKRADLNKALVEVSRPHRALKGCFALREIVWKFMQKTSRQKWRKVTAHITFCKINEMLPMSYNPQKNEVMRKSFCSQFNVAGHGFGRAATNGSLARFL